MTNQSTNSSTIAMSHLRGGPKAWTLVAGEVVALAVMVIVTTSIFTAADAARLVAGMAVAYLVPRFILARSRWLTAAAQWLLLAVALALSCYAIVSIEQWTVAVGHTLEMPLLHNDDNGYYSWALAHYDGRCPVPKIPFKGLPLFMLAMWKVLGVSVVWPIALNLMFTLITIVMTGKLAVRLLSRHFTTLRPSTIATLAMLIVPFFGFFISQDLRIQKEAGCGLGLVLVGYALAGFNGVTTHSKRQWWLMVATFVTGCLILAMVRTNFVYFAVIGAAMMAVACKCMHWKKSSLLALTALAIAVGFSLLFSYSFGQQYRTVDGGDAMARAFKIGIVQQPYVALVGDYFHYPEWKRLLLLPVTAAVQYIIPFPWIYDGADCSLLSVMPRLRLMWYAVGGLCMFYYLYVAIVHHRGSNMGMWAWWPAAIFLIIAFITGGAVSRYILPLQPLFAVIALFVVLQVRSGNYRRSFVAWLIVYTFVMIALLIVCYHIQVSYLDSLNEYYRLKALKHI